MGGNVYNTNDNQRMTGYNGGYQTGYQRRRHELPPLGTGSQYGTVQGGISDIPPSPLGMDGFRHPMIKKGYKAMYGEMPQRQGQGERGRARLRREPRRE